MKCTTSMTSCAVRRARQARRTRRQVERHSSVTLAEVQLSIAAVERALDAWLDAPDWVTSRALLERHARLLLEPLAPALLTVWIHRAEESGDPVALAAGHYLRWHLRVLRRAMHQGIAVAWAAESPYQTS